MSRLLPLLLIGALAQGCYAVRYTNGDVDNAMRRGAETHKTWSHNVLWGLASANKVDIDKYCGDAGAMELKSHYGPFGLFAQVVSLGFWTPLRVKVTCNPPAPAIAAAPPQPPQRPLAVPAGSPPQERGIVVVPEDGRTVIIVQQ